ncbi:V-type proton ATPase 116 kDa subunit a 1-like [Clavelina lepadiformis]|uniref:V-type proton ATPase 116 kDa subunit a 1-like n=1 Tax=Clavelina lepadiformis TaxID=159417 RepID=UPI004042DC72
MGSLYRSEEMCLAQLYLQSEAAFACVSELGELGLVQFRDLNPNVNAFLRKFVHDVRRCDEMERKLRFLERELNKDNIPVDDDGDVPFAPLPREMIELEGKFEKLESDMKEVNGNQEALRKNFLELSELKQILKKTQGFFEEATMYQTEHTGFAPELEEDSSRAGDLSRGPFTKLGFVAGVILREKMLAFERVLWRACRGNVFLRHVEMEVPLVDPYTGDKVNKCVFIIFFQGDQLKNRVKKICEGFRATLYPCPENPQERREIAVGVTTRLEDLQTVLNQTEDHRRIVLSQVARNIRVWFIKVRKIKAIYDTLNLFNVNIAEKCLIAECWCPVADLEKIQGALRHATETSGSSVPSILQIMKSDESPPTYNRTNAFTYGFETLIDAFGVANYREVNPTPFTIISFPFLFAVMFGDLGHGFLMLLFSLYMLYYQRYFLRNKTDNEIWEMMFGGRYLILLMGLFSMYTGFLYNECFSISVNVFGSAWNVSADPGWDTEYLKSQTSLMVDPGKPGVFRGSTLPYPNSTGNPYPYGIDPIWQLASNKITFLNSYKMKGAVILGFVQMMFGLILALNNHLYFKNYLSLFCEWIPQIIFLLCVIGYLVILIFYKWAVWSAADSSQAPSLLIGLINMFMFTAPSQTADTVIFSGQAGLQHGLQIFIVLLAVFCIPWMLFTKPAIIYYRNKQKQATAGYGEIHTSANGISDRADILAHDELNINHESELDSSSESDKHEEEEFEMGQFMIIQVIHTIEYCLSCISHTASYLRLWALSLAHSELSQVLWTMVMSIGLTEPGALGAVMSFLLFWVFSSLTVGILLIMEGLSAFLHALRLHWVEFQSKFYKGEGYMFSPFSFHVIVEGKSEE